MSLHKKIKGLVKTLDVNIVPVLERIRVSNSSYYRYINGTSDIYSENLSKILKELGIDIEQIISQKVNKSLDGASSKASIGEDFEQIFRSFSRTNKITLLDTVISDAQKLDNGHLQEPLNRLMQYKSLLRARRSNDSRGNRK